MKKLLCLIACLAYVTFPLIADACLIPKNPGLVNGGFETGDFTGWTPGGNNGVVSLANLQLDLFNPAAGSLGVTPFEGQFMGALTYPVLEGFVYDNFIYQDVELGKDDKILVFSYFFWTYDEAPFDSPGFTVSINGMTVFSQSAGDIGDGVVGTLDFTGWTTVAIDVSQYYSGDPTRPVTIQIAFNAGNTGDSQFASGVFLDDIKLIVPVPASILLLGSGLLGLIGLRRKFRSS